MFDEWCHLGLRDVVICPGSRSTPLALACAERSEVTLHIRIDERSAGFFAIGRALATSRPVAIVVTSGTAAAELHAAVAEADLARVPLLVLTADRPPELHGVGAPQTIEQDHLFGPMVRQFEDPGVATSAGAGSWRALARSLWRAASATAGRGGPVHLNAAFVEPLLAEPLSLPAPLDDETVRESTVPVAPLLVHGKRVLCVVGHGVDPRVIEECVALEWAVVGDATAQGTIAYFDPLLRARPFADAATPDLVVRLGGLVASKVLQEQLRRWGALVIALDGAGFVADPDRVVSETVSGLPRRDVRGLRGDRGYAAFWRRASDAVGERLSDYERDQEVLSEPLLARALVQASGAHEVPLVVGSSMPVRDVEWWAPARTMATYSNRGANGIDGVVSTVFGVASGSKAIGFVGDVTMLHDVSGLVDGLGEQGGTCVLVVADNHGGGIFSFLPQAAALDEERFERLFGTPRGHDLARVAAAFGHHSVTATTMSQLRSAIGEGLDRSGISVVVAKMPSRSSNVALHEQLNEMAAAAWSDAP